jgi:hypothetical protein
LVYNFFSLSSAVSVVFLVQCVVFITDPFERLNTVS